jgi:hypothetical protein
MLATHFNPHGSSNGSHRAAERHDPPQGEKRGENTKELKSQLTERLIFSETLAATLERRRGRAE